ncbi:MAG TPA: hypothetical protein PLW78_01325 [bacterium]|nr:hypothetical protein [bacterium]MDX9806311.1 hypothetical protein [bacterium]HNZ52836.1 hypothetical protein [bacterium]HPM46615.1 hypothetical protein [bacterium]HQN73041.1 hypothetical protein [bacterium]
MNKRNIIMGLMLIAMIGIFYFKESSVEKNVSKNIEKESVKLFENFDASSLRSIDITNLKKGEKVTFEKSGDNWIVKDKNCNADKNAIMRIIETLPKIRLGRDMGAFSPDHMNEYGFDKGLEIQAGGKVIMLGDQKGVSIALKDGNNIYLAPFGEKYVFEKHDGNWCEKTEEKKPETAE